MSAPNHIPPLLVEPPIDRPAAEDPVTAYHLRLLARTSRLGIVTLVVMVTVLVLAGVVMVTTDGNPVLLVAGLLSSGVAARTFVQRRKWLHGMGELAGRSPWRGADAVVVRARPCVLRVDDGTGPHFLRVPACGAPGQAVIARTGQVWLLGPDASRRTGVALPGLRTPLQATPVPAPPAGAGPVFPPPGTTGTALDDPVTGAIVRQWVAAARRILLLVGVMLLLSLVVRDVTASTVTIWVASAVLLGTTGWALRLTPALRRGLRRGPWTAANARLDPWPDTDRGAVPLRGQVQLPDGQVTAVELRHASRMLCEHVAATGHLHFAGPPVPGHTCTVGVPGTLILGLATVHAL